MSPHLPDNLCSAVASILRLDGTAAGVGRETTPLERCIAPFERMTPIHHSLA